MWWHEVDVHLAVSAFSIGAATSAALAAAIVFFTRRAGYLWADRRRNGTDRKEKK